VVVVVLTSPAASWVVGTVEGAVAIGVGATVGVGIVDGAAVVPSGIVGTAVATTGGAILGGAITGPDGAVTPCGARCPSAVALFSPGLVTFRVSHRRNGPETDVSGRRAFHVRPLPRQEADNPIRAVFLGHMGLPRPQILIPRCPPIDRPLHFQVGVWVDHCEFPGDLAAASLA
jgi:hypothetical protein